MINNTPSQYYKLTDILFKKNILQELIIIININKECDKYVRYVKK